MPDDVNGLTGTLRALAKLETDVPVLSAYLDLRPQATGETPVVRAGQIVLRARARELCADLREHTPEYASLQSDLAAVEAAIDESLPDAQGMAFFSCSAAGVLETALLPVPPESTVTLGAAPDLVPLARIVDQGSALVALHDTNTLRLFILRAGGLTEIPGLDASPDEFGKHLANRGELGGRVDERRAEFARQAATVIDRALERHRPAWLIASEDELALPILKDKLSKKALGLLRDTIPLDIRASYGDILAGTAPIVDRVRREDAHAAADTLVDEVGEHDLGVGGLEQTRAALERGQGLELLIDDTSGVAQDALTDLVRLAVSTDAPVRFVEGHAGLLALGGVGALLRFRIEPETERADAA